MLIANDITTMAGSFGPQEDALFYLASVHARQRKIPRFFFSVRTYARTHARTYTRAHARLLQ